MMLLQGSLSERTVLEVVREVHVRRASGLLEIDSPGQRRRLHFIDGELHLPGAHPLAQHLAREVASVRATAARPGPEAAAARQRLLQLVERIARVISDWRVGDYRFEPGEPSSAGDLVGPLPTRRLLMLGATLGVSEEELLQRLGGAEARWTSGADAEGPADLLGLSPEERFVLERLRGPMPVRQLLAEAPEVPGETLLRVAQLRAVGLVVSVREPGQSRSAGAAATEDGRLLLEKLSERIRGRLEEEPIELGEAEHRALVGDLLARFGGLDHYELLGVRPDASEAKIQEAYERIARRVHPSHAARLGLAGRAAALAMLFETVTTAYRTLSDPESRRRYNERHLIDVSPEISATDRQQEARTLARSHFERALSYSSAGDVHSAIQLLEQASRIDPQSEYLSHLARHLARNPNWRERALETYRTALELDPKNAEIRYEMGMLHEELGDPARARASYSAALSAAPSHAGARQRLERLLDDGKEGPGGEGSKGRGFFARLFGRG